MKILRTDWYRRGISFFVGVGLIFVILFVSVQPALTADPLDITETPSSTLELTLTNPALPYLPGTLILTPLYALPGFDLWRFSYTEPDWDTTLTGIIHKPEGNGPFPGVLISHGKGGTAEGFSLVKAQSWFPDYISIAPNYTHAANDIGGIGPQGGSPENVKRAIRCLDILQSQNFVDSIGDSIIRDRLYLYGNSMGGFVTIETAAQAGSRVKGAAYTASGLSQSDPQLTPSGAAAAATVQAPFLLLHGQMDGTVIPAASQTWADALASFDRPFQLVWFPNTGHDLNANELTTAQVAQFIRDWFSLPAPQITGLSTAVGSPGDQLTVNGSSFGTNINSNSQLLFNRQIATPLLWSETAITTTVPIQANSGPVRLIVPVGPISDAQVFQPVTGGQRSNDVSFTVIPNQTSTETLAPSPTWTETPSLTSTLTPSKETETPAATPTNTAISTATPTETGTSTITPTPTQTPTNSPTSTPSPSPSPTITASPTQTPGNAAIFSDNFDQPDNSIIGNDWLEVETTGAQVGIQSNRLCFLDTSDVANRPMVSHSLPPVSSGELTWQFDFDWKRTGTEKAYRLGGVDTSLAVVSGPAVIRVTANLDTTSYQVAVNGVTVGSALPFDNQISLDSMRFFTDGLNEVYFSGRCFDNVSIAGGSSPPPSPTPSDTPSPTLEPTAALTPTPTDTPTRTETGQPTLTPTATLTHTPSPSPSSSPTPTASPSSSPTPTATLTHTSSPSPTLTPTASLTPPPTPSQTPSSDPLDYVARWKFDEGSGTSASDTSTNANTLTLYNGATWASGHSSYALSLDGTNDYASRTDASLVGAFPAKSSNAAQHFTLSTWVRLDRTGINQSILTKQGTRKANGFNFYVAADNKLSLEVFSGNNTSTLAKSTASLGADNWYHVAVTYDYVSSNGSVIKIYLNGSLDRTLTNAVGPLRTNTQPLIVGWYAGDKWYLDGLIDELRVFARVLNDQEIASLAR